MSIRLLTRTRLAKPLPSILLQARTMSIETPNTNTKAVNRTGLTPEESKKLAPRQAQPEETSFLKRLHTMYACDGSISDDTYSMFTDDAIFHDPVGHADGIGHIREQFNGLHKIFEKAVIEKQELLTNPPSLPNTTLVVDQVVAYYRKAAQEQPTKTVNSLICMERNSQGKVVRLQEEWDHRGEKDSSDGFLGQLSEWRKKLTVAVTGAGLTQDPKKV